METKDSKIAPSSAATWVKCPGSVVVAPQGPESGSDSGREGDAAHWVAAGLLAGQLWQDAAPNGVIITDKIVGHVALYVGDVQGTLGSMEGFSTPGVGCEDSINIARIHPQCFGSVDFWVFNPDTNTLYLWDFKYGWGLIEVFENWQLICYALGLVDYLTGGNLFDTDITVVMRIVQPRPYHRDGPIREWSVPAVELRGYGNRLYNAAAEALGSNPRIVSGSHCRYCAGRSICPAARQATLFAIDLTEKATVDSLPVEALGFEFQMLQRAKEMIDHRITGLEALIKTKILAGTNVPGWCIEPGTGKRVWKESVKNVIALGQVMGIDLEKPKAAITPSQAKLLKGANEALINSQSEVERTAFKLIPVEKSVAYAAFKKEA